METHEVICQLRADLKADLPAAILLSPGVREELASTLGFPISPSPTTRLTEPRESGTRSPVVEDEIDLEGGLFRQEDGSVLVIENLSVSNESIYVRARASTSDCRLLIRTAAEVLESYGAPSWAALDPDFDHATSSSVTLDFPIERLLSKELCDFLSSAVSDSALGDVDGAVEIHPFNLSFKIHVFPSSNRVADQARGRKRLDLKIGHRRVTDHDKRLFDIFSEFDSDTHFDLLNTLEAQLAEKADR